jgi:hypothetical protein
MPIIASLLASLIALLASLIASLTTLLTCLANCVTKGKFLTDIAGNASSEEFCRHELVDLFLQRLLLSNHI